MTAILQSRKVEISEIPVLDFAQLERGPAARAKLHADMRQACETIGFFYMQNHGVSAAACDKILGEAHRLFALSKAELQEMAMTKSPFYRGFLEIGQRGTNLERPPDILEAFNLGQDYGPDHPGVKSGKKLHGPNQWPKNLPGFKEAVIEWQGLMDGTMRKVLHALAGAIDVPYEQFGPWFDKPLCQMRLLHYPPQPPQIGHMMGARPHQDTSFMTILLQDDRGGLEVEARNGEWLQAPPRKDMFVVNVGEYLELYTSGVCYPAKHRVVNRSGKARYSVPFFFSPNFDTVVDPLPDFAAKPNARPFKPMHIGNDMARFFNSLWPTVGSGG